jgi:hypothetical protein
MVAESCKEQPEQEPSVAQLKEDGGGAEVLVPDHAKYA